MGSTFTGTGIMVATDEPELVGCAAAIAGVFAGFDARAALFAARDRYWLAEDAANVTDPSPEVLAAWEQARVAFEAARAAVGS